ncbi:TPA: hypothetical protein ACGF9S_003390 [Vibrio cholerae]
MIWLGYFWGSVRRATVALAEFWRRLKLLIFSGLSKAYRGRFVSLFVDTKSDSPAEASLRFNSAISCKLKSISAMPQASTKPTSVTPNISVMKKRNKSQSQIMVILPKSMNQHLELSILAV